ncbi:hypothetical protein F5X68DRAFT_246659 [Plectosphaerella plurivora]|uniref:NAD(P)-binding domain-containing protein n=1 Tax=Plectosphaerella plurivora TaxID=936078 RepID=A0A9P8V5C2_9PEZI|nr:hypothetical protein F5X68DRAFT_246659 [Plectosphaerella plurivora]
MTGKILVFGGSGPAGLCLLRELAYRNHEVIAYVRNASKIPEDLRTNPLIEVVKGEITDRDALSKSIAQSTVIISLLGPNTIRGVNEATFTDFYKLVLSLMREHHVKRIFAMSTVSCWTPEDAFSLVRLLLVSLVFVVANGAWRTVRGIARTFEEHGNGVDWTVYRIAGIPGGSDEASWKADREDGLAYEGGVAQEGWSLQQKRGALARWLVDAAEDGKAQWIGKMPAVSRLAGSKRRAE